MSFFEGIRLFCTWGAAKTHEEDSTPADLLARALAPLPAAELAEAIPPAWTSRSLPTASRLVFVEAVVMAGLMAGVHLLITSLTSWIPEFADQFAHHFVGDLVTVLAAVVFYVCLSRRHWFLWYLRLAPRPRRSPTSSEVKPT
jgi:hypothetical protein